MSESRQNPDVLLAKVNAEAAKAQRGTLRIFFGYAAGVGKTYAMLQAACQLKENGQEAVVGYVEPHARPETQALLSSLNLLPVKDVEYRGVIFREFDVDAALALHPEILLVDELAHTNVVGCRHEKRWQDVEELRDAGINVWTTLNVQHIDSLNDVIGQITGVTVRETVPDHVFDSADDLELIDITPEELLDRLQAGKIYVPEQAQRAILNFFQKSNLSALRELSLRQAARRIHTDVESDRRDKAAMEPWATSERLLVCIGPSPTTTRVIRNAKRLAAALDAPWLAVSVDLTGQADSSPAAQQIAQHFRLAEQLGAEAVTLAGQNIAETILSYARSRNVTKILIGKTDRPRWHRLFVGTVVDELLEQSREIDVYVIHGAEEKHPTVGRDSTGDSIEFRPYLESASSIALSCVAAYALKLLQFADAEANTVMLFLAAVAWTAFRFGRGPAILASVLAVLSFDYFFVTPFHTFAVADAQYIVTFGVMLAIGLVISTLTSRLRAQVVSTRLRERRTSVLYELGKQLSSLYGKVFLASAAGEKLSDLLDGKVAVYLQTPSGLPEVAYCNDMEISCHSVSLPTAQWVIDRSQIAGAGTNTLPNAIALFLPLIASHRTLGAIAIRVAEKDSLLVPDQRRLLEACANQLALALERDQLAIEAADARIEAEAEQVRSSLLSSVSHDLKTPLASIAGASSSLLAAPEMDLTTRQQLLETVSEEAVRLNRLLENILQMSKLDAGASPANLQWHVLEEIVGSALHRTRDELRSHTLTIQLSIDLPLLLIDGLLIEQVFVNLLENAARYTPPGTHVAIQAAIDGKFVRISVADNGPGFPPDLVGRIFDKFFRATSSADGGRGSGLGLAICRAIAKVHGGNITASNRPGGGAEFILRIPVRKDAPQVSLE